MWRYVDKPGLILFPLLVGGAIYRMANDPTATTETWLVFLGLLAICGVLLVVYVKGLRKLARMDAHFRYVSSLKGPDLVKYLIEKRNRGKR